MKQLMQNYPEQLKMSEDTKFYLSVLSLSLIIMGIPTTAVAVVYGYCPF